MGINWVAVIINWFPILLLAGVWIFFLRFWTGMGRMTKFQAAYVEQLSRQATALERIAATMEKNAPQ